MVIKLIVVMRLPIDVSYAATFARDFMNRIYPPVISKSICCVCVPVCRNTYATRSNITNIDFQTQSENTSCYTSRTNLTCMVLVCLVGTPNMTISNLNLNVISIETSLWRFYFYEPIRASLPCSSDINKFKLEKHFTPTSCKNQFKIFQAQMNYEAIL